MCKKLEFLGEWKKTHVNYTEELESNQQIVDLAVRKDVPTTSTLWS